MERHGLNMLTQNIDKWRNFVSTVMQIRVSYNVG